MTDTAPMQHHELLAWLGDDWTDDQIAEIIRLYAAAEEATPEDEREALLVAICQRVDGTLDRQALVDADQRAQLAAEEARRARRGGLRADIAAGMSESEAARLWQVSRGTARHWVGKTPSGWAD